MVRLVKKKFVKVEKKFAKIEKKFIKSKKIINYGYKG